MVALSVSEGPGAGQRLELDGELVLGRDGDFGAGDEQLSRRHALVRRSSGGVEVEDLGSLNGTFVNGRRIEATTSLREGDVVQVGTTVLTVEGETSAGATVLSPAPAHAERAPQAEPVPAPAPPAPAQLGVFGTHGAPEQRRGRGRGASRQLTPTLVSFAVVVATAAALVVYFAQH